MFTIIAFAYCISLFAQTAGKDNKVSQSITFHAIPKGATVSGVFQGRPPCAGIAGPLHLQLSSNCEKIKCNLTLYRDSVTQQPTTYELTCIGAGDIINQPGGGYRQKILQGKWSVTTGMPTNSNAEIYKLSTADGSSFLYLLKGDDNVLFVLDQNKQLMAGDENFSYTLNRVQLVAGK